MREEMDIGASLRGALDAAFYAEVNPDVARAGVEPVQHFLTTGWAERRHFHPRLQRLLGFGFREGVLGSSKDLLSVFRAEDLPLIVEGAWWERLRAFFQPVYYQAQLQEAGMALPADAEILEHFLLIGLPGGMRPSILFDAGHYATHVLGVEEASPAAPFLEWLAVGHDRREVPTPLFDQRYYESTYVDMATYKGWSFAHYYIYGIRESRKPIHFFDPVYFRKRAPKVRLEEHLLDYALHYPDTGTAPGMSLNLPRETWDLVSGTPLERFARLSAAHLFALEQGTLKDVVARAAAIEPLIWQPGGPRQVMAPPLRHDQNSVRQAATAILDSLGHTPRDAVVLVPHCRVGGAARVAGAFEGALRAAHPRARIVLLTTESPEFQRPDWFEGAEIVDISEALKLVEPASRKLVLASVMRSIQCKTMVTINSRAGWEVISGYGAQLSTEMRLVAYLFTYDLNRDGRKVGYPIGPLQAGLDHLDLVITDNATLRTELVERYRMPPGRAMRLQTLYTPVDPVEADFSVAPPRAAERPRVIWAGRFDRQKRFDIVIELARSWPELEVWAWGKSVIGDFDFSRDELPPNIKLKGEFEAFDDLPLSEADLLLYTSEWDGLPTLLIDAGLRGLSVVASLVGGVGEIVDESTGWPVEPATDPKALRVAIEAVLADPIEARRRGAALRERVRRQTAPAGYLAEISVLFPELAQA